MSGAVSLACPSCGARLQITEDVERFACLHCGNEQLVRRSGGIVSLAPVVEGLTKVQRGTDKTAAELAIPRLRAQLEEIRGDRQALMGQIQHLEQVSLNEIIAPTQWEQAYSGLVVIALLMSCGAFLNTSLWFFAWLIALVAGIVLFVRMYYRRRKAAQAEVDYQIGRIYRELDRLGRLERDKTDALNRNLEIVD